MSQVTKRTERTIIAAMISLLEKKQFDKITVGDICDEALINHSTFYRYFTDKFDLLHAVFTYMLTDLTANSENAETIISQTADFVERNNSFMRHISPQYQTRANLYPEFRSILQEIVKKKYQEPDGQKDPLIQVIAHSETPEIMISFLVGGLIGIVEYLEDNDFDVPRDQFITFAEQVLKNWEQQAQLKDE